MNCLDVCAGQPAENDFSATPVLSIFQFLEVFFGIRSNVEHLFELGERRSTFDESPVPTQIVFQ